jgi:hypothetical protein
MGRVLQVVLAALLAGVIAVMYWPYLFAVAGFALSHLLFPALWLFLFGILFGLIGADYGLPGLFWHDRIRTRLGAATAVTLLLALTGVLAFYTDPPSRESVTAVLERLGLTFAGPEATEKLGGLGRFLLAASPPFLALLLAPALFPAAFPRVPRSVPAILISRQKVGPTMGKTMSIATNPAAYALSLFTWLGGVALGVVIVVLLRWVAGAVHDWRLFQEAGEHGIHHRGMLIFFLILALFYAVLSAKPVYDRVVSPAFAICALLGLLATAYAVLAYIYQWSFQGGMMLVVLGLALWFALINNDPYKLRFPKMDAYYPKGSAGLVPLRPRVDEIARDFGIGGALGRLRLIRDEDALRNWSGTIEGEAKPKLAVVSVSGGALRSGLWVAIVLDRIEKQIPGFGRHVRLITGASGGMVGAGYYLIHRRQAIGLPGSPTAPGPYRPSDWVLSIPRDSLEPVARFIALRDPFLAFLPRVVADDRGIRLEDDWKDLAIPFRDLSGEEEAGRIPSMILSPLMIEDGRRLLISNLDLGSLIGSAGNETVSDGPGGTERLYSLSALEFYRLFPEATGFRLGTGVRMNASFPYVSPSVSLPTVPTRRVFDAGGYDNYGIQVSAAWIHKNFDWLVTNTSGVVLVQIRDAISSDARLGVADLPSGPLAGLSRGFRFFTSAPEAAESARTASAMFRNDEDIAALSERFAQAKGGDLSFFTTVIFENSAQVTYLPPDPGAWPGDTTTTSDTAAGVALDWYLTRAERDSLIAAIPMPAPDGPWVDRQRRLARIAELRQRVAAASGAARVEALTQLEQAENYERLVLMDDWWKRP